MSDRAFILGAGKVGRGLALALRRGNVDVIGVHARSPRDGATSSGSLPRSMVEANVVIVGVRDTDLRGAVDDLVSASRLKPPLLTHGAVVLITSGSAPSTVLQPLRALGVSAGTFHPLAPFPSAERGAEALRDGWIGIDGDPVACAASRRLAAAVGARTLTIPAGAKATYHAAAVFASNFPVVLAAIAEELLAASGVDARAAHDATHQLMRAAAENVGVVGARTALTGPVARGDEGTIASHREALSRDPVVLSAYDALTSAARRLAADHGAAVNDSHVGGRDEVER